MTPLFKLAARARNQAYAPYSRYRVGAAIRLKNGKTFVGCNVENSTYGATTCAEQIAVFNAVSAEGPRIEIAELLVVTDSTPPAACCGICRQVIAEFADPAVPIHLANPAGQIVTTTLSELLPKSFTGAILRASQKRSSKKQPRSRKKT